MKTIKLVAEVLFLGALIYGSTFLLFTFGR